MILKEVKIDKNFNDLEKLNELNIEAFPVEERLDLSEMLEMTRHSEVDFIALYDAENFVGFYLIFKKYSCAYIYFLTIAKEFRNKGYGTGLLELLNKKYIDYQIILDLEEVDEKALNNSQRITRKKFYLRNLYKEAGYGMAYVGMRFEILFCGDEIKIKNFEELIEQTKSIINSYCSNKFLPTIFKR